MIPMTKADEMIDVSDVAAALIERAGPMGSMKLMKLTYYAQAWHAAIYGEPLFRSRIEAWFKGPVAPVLWAQYSNKEYSSITAPISGDSGRLSSEHLELIELVVSEYGSLSGAELSRRSHEESPWVEARGGIGENERSTSEISIDAMVKYFANQTLCGHSPIEIAVVGVSPRVDDEDRIRSVVSEVLEKYSARNISDDLVDSGYVAFSSGVDESSFAAELADINQILRR